MGSSLDIDIDVYFESKANLGKLITERKSKHYIIQPSDYYFNNIFDINVIDPEARTPNLRYIVNGFVFTLEASIDEKKETLYGGSADSWDDFLSQMYILCKKTPEGMAARAAIAASYQACFRTPISSSNFINKIGIIGDSSNIELNHHLLLNDEIIKLIKKFKKESATDQSTVNDIVNIADRVIFNNYITGASAADKNQAFIDTQEAREEFRNILNKIKNARVDQPKIYQNVFDKNQIQDEILFMTTLLDEKPNKTFTVDDIYNLYKQFNEEKVSLFKKNFIGDENGTGESAAEQELKLLLKKEIDKLSDTNNNILIIDDKHYRLNFSTDNVIKSLSKLYKVLPLLEKKALLKEIVNYIRK